MSVTKQWTEEEKKQLKIFMIVNFGMTILMGIVMGISYKQGNDVTAFASTQMMYPAAGVILALIFTIGKSRKLPMKFFITYLVTAVLALLLTVAGVIIPSTIWYVVQAYIIIIGSLAAWVMLLIEKKDVKDDFGLRFGGHDTKKSFLLMLLFFMLYLMYLFLASLMEGSIKEVAGIFASPMTWINMINLFINYFLTFIIFFGEEYGWRYFLHPFLQKRFGLKQGVLLLGVIWGLWHLPISICYYSPDTWYYSVLVQLIACVSFAVFFGYAYGKTGNMWVPIVIHYINNNMSAVLSGGELGNKVYRWQDVLIILITQMILFMPFLFTKVYKQQKESVSL